MSQAYVTFSVPSTVLKGALDGYMDRFEAFWVILN